MLTLRRRACIAVEHSRLLLPPFATRRRRQCAVGGRLAGLDPRTSLGGGATHSICTRRRASGPRSLPRSPGSLSQRRIVERHLGPFPDRHETRLSLPYTRSTARRGALSCTPVGLAGCRTRRCTTS